MPTSAAERQRRRRALRRAGRALLRIECDPGRVADLLHDSGLITGTTTDASWASALADYRFAVGAFTDALKTSSSFDLILAQGGFRRLPMRTGSRSSPRRPVARHLLKAPQSRSLGYHWQTPSLSRKRRRQ
jgi:hypothetical protein